MLLLLGLALLAVAGVVYLLGYRGGGRPPAETQAVTTSVAPTELRFTNAGATRISSYAATVGWATSDPSTARLQWGPLGVVPVLWETVRSFGTRHVVTLEGLASSTSYEVTITASSLARKSIRANVSFTTAPAPGEMRGAVRDSVLLVNGEPFFPLIAWQQCIEQLPASAAAGIDLFAGGSCAGLSTLLDGLRGRALVAGGDGDAPATGPGLLGWFYPDEADARGLTGASLPRLPAGVRFLTVTSHFAAGAAPLPDGPSVYRGLAAAADVVGFDLYPLQQLCRRDLLSADFDVQQQLEALAPGRPTFQWIEARGMQCGNGGGLAISPSTIRAESWLALAAGAHGLAFFPPDWDLGALPAIRGIATRIRQIEPALLRPVVPVRVSAAPGVRASARVYHDAAYVIAVNGGTTASDVRLRVPGLADRTLLVVGRSRTLRARGGVLTDRLSPLAVRIYVAPPSR